MEAPEVDPKADERPRIRGGEPGEDAGRTHEARRLDGVHQMAGHRGVDRGDTGDVDDDDRAAPGRDRGSS